MSALDDALKVLERRPDDAELFAEARRCADLVLDTDPRAAFRAYQTLLRVAPANDDVRATTFRLARALSEQHPRALGSHPTLGEVWQGAAWLHPWEELARTLAQTPVPSNGCVYARFVDIAKMWSVAGETERAARVLEQATEGIASLVQTKERFCAQLRAEGGRDEQVARLEAELDTLAALARTVEETRDELG